MQNIKISLLLILFASVVCAPAVLARDYEKVDPPQSRALYLSGVYKRGHDLTEPRAKSGEYLKTDDAGVLVFYPGAAFYWRILPLKPIPDGYIIRTTWPNPASPDQPLINTLDAEVDEATYKEYIFMPTSPDFIDGLERHGIYEFKAELLTSEESDEPVEVLIQKVRSYVITKDGEVWVYGGMPKR